MSPFALALQLTVRGLLQKRKYSYLGVDLYSKNEEGAQHYIIEHDNQIHKFRNPGKAVITYMNMIKILRKQSNL